MIDETLGQPTVSYMGSSEPWTVLVDPADIALRLEPFNGRRRAYLCALLNGRSKAMAAAAAGITPRCAQLWAKNEPSFGAAVRFAEQVGFGSVIESELYRRALAGAGDRGSIRALELVVKARDSAYREKSQVQMDIAVQAQGAMAALAGGWRDKDLASLG